MNFISVFLGKLNHKSNLHTATLLSGDISLPSPQSLPTSLENFKEWHYRALRRLNGHIIGEPFSGKLSLEVDFNKFIPILIEMGLIYEGTWQDSLSSLKIDDLKKILKCNSLPVSGNKSTLINRIICSVSYESIKSCGYGFRTYLHTQAAKDAIKKSYAILEAEKLSLFMVHYKMIYEGELDRAYRSICMQKSVLPLPPGLGFDWRSAANNGIPEQQFRIYSDMLKKTKNREITAVTIYTQISGESESTALAMYQKMKNFNTADKT